MMLPVAIFASCWTVSCTALLVDETEQNWPQFRGPAGNGVAIHANPPTEWTPESAKWSVEIPGKGSASPVVWGDKIILLTAIETERKAPEAEEEEPAEPEEGRRSRFGRRRPKPTQIHEFLVLCVDRKTGKTLWQTKVNEAVPHESGHSTNTQSSGSPITDGKHIWASFNSFGLFCLDMDGQVKWERQLGTMSTRNGFGEGATPALYGDTLVVNWDHEGQSFIEAMDAKTGKTKWKKDRDERTTWSTPLIVKFGDKVQIVTNGTNRVRSYDLANGDLIWECGGQAGNPIPTPMVIDDMVICMTGFRGNAAMGIPLDSQGDITDTDKITWARRDIGPYVPTGVLYKGQIYSTKGSSSVMTAVDAKTGETIIDEVRLEGMRELYASMVAANDHIFITGRNGNTLVLKHGDEMEVIAANELGEPVDATPAIVGDEIIIRSDKHLFCFENNP
ncbi:MAG: PQQ-binding-like beta-propeller repeat protein [Mariniblastus sp.]|nr:PQQ-binding-like beta-propeller repeat protein [Mariniblastus sp.]